jgi:hypothetical protein
VCDLYEEMHKFLFIFAVMEIKLRLLNLLISKCCATELDLCPYDIDYLI